MNQLKTEIDLPLKKAFRELAIAKNMTEAALLRHLAKEATALHTQNLRAVQAPGTVQSTKTITVYIADFLKIAVRHRAKTNRMTSSAWVASLIQSHLMQEPVMTHNQLLALNLSTRELTAIGRNINQIAKALNELPRDHQIVTMEQLALLRTAIENNKDSLRRLVRASQQAWGQL